MPKTKRFIDKKNAVTFNLVHRSQKDPLAADETAPQRVLVPVTLKAEKKAEASSSQQDPVKRKEELTQYGIFFDDDYDYLQHLKDVNLTAEWELAENSSNSRTWKAPLAKGVSEPKLKLPSSVFPSGVEEEIGLLNRAAPHSGPRPDLDPDIVAALDDDFDFDDPDNELDDNFIEMANLGGVDDDGEDDDDESEDEDEEGEEEEDEDGDRFSSDCDRFSPTFGRDPYDNEDTKSRFTEYSMTSSVIRRNQQLTLLDDRFEQFAAGYDDEEMGALDCEEIEGYIESSDKRLLKLAEEFEKEKGIGLQLGDQIGKKVRPEVEAGVEKYLERLGSGESQEESDEDEEEDEPKQKWDCESILSTYSNLYNHPKLIAEPAKPAKIAVCPKTGIPQNVLGKPGLTKKFLEQLDEAARQSRDEDGDTRSMVSTLSTLSIRPKDETAEQRKERKQMVKDYRRERRLEKKANTLAFKEEKKRQVQQNLNNRVNIQGLKLL